MTNARFIVPNLSTQGVVTAKLVADAISEFAQNIERMGLDGGRDHALMMTKLEELQAIVTRGVLAADSANTATGFEAVRTDMSEHQAVELLIEQFGRPASVSKIARLGPASFEIQGRVADCAVAMRVLSKS